MIRSALLSGVFLAAFGSVPAHAVLEISASIGGSTFTCVDNSACDTNPTVGSLTTNPVTLAGIEFSASNSLSLSGPLDALSSSFNLIRNTSASPVLIRLAVGDTDYTFPVLAFHTAGSGTWQGPGGSSAQQNWFVDPANSQGASTPTTTPGVQIDTDSFTSPGVGVLGFAHNGGPLFASPTEFSMTEQSVLVLLPGGSIVNAGETMIGSAVVPEASTWAMLGIGAAFMAYGIRRRNRDHRFSI